MKKAIILLVIAITYISCKESKPTQLSFKNILVFGNSITIHPPNPSVGWFSNHGKAASSKEKDYIHLISAKLNNNIIPVNISSWEGSHATFSLSEYDKHFKTLPDMVIIRLGENVLNHTGFETSLQKLIDYVKSKAPKSKLLITGTFWTNEPVNNILKSVSIINDIPFVPLSQLDNKENISAIGEYVTSEDGTKYKITDHGVASHPGDLGMKNIADTILKKIEFISKIK